MRGLSDLNDGLIQTRGVVAPSRSGIRRLIDLTLRADSDLEAFVIDHFAEVGRQFSGGMDRKSKVNLLLLQHEPAEILAALRGRDGVARHMPILTQIEESPEAQAVNELSLRIKKVGVERATRLMRGEPVDELDQEIVRLRREQRQGPQLHESEELAERYHLLELIGRGGFANVWQAYDHQLGQIVAVKVLHADLGSGQSLQRFLSGAQQMLSLCHSSIVRVLAPPTSYRGFHYFVMEYLPGGDLAKAVRGGMVSEKALRAILEVGQGLVCAHQRGLIHRDVKPANILMNEAGHAKLTDFDLVRGTLDSHGTRTGALGTFIYAAPEELENAKKADQRADVYSLGMTTLFVLYGKELPSRAFQNGERFIKQLQCSDRLKSLLNKATAWEPNDRHPTVIQFCADLADAMGETDQALALGWSAKQTPTRRYLRLAVLAPAATMLVLFGVLVLLIVAVGIYGGIRSVWHNKSLRTTADTQVAMASMTVESQSTSSPVIREGDRDSQLETSQTPESSKLPLNSSNSPWVREPPAGPFPEQWTAIGPMEQSTSSSLVHEPGSPPIKDASSRDIGTRPSSARGQRSTFVKPLPLPGRMPLNVPAELAMKDKISTDDEPHLPVALKAQRRGQRLVGAYSICVGSNGRVSSVHTVERIPGADESIRATLIEKWQFRRQAFPLCFTIPFTFQIE